MSRKRSWKDVAIYAGVWTLLGFFATTQSFVTSAFLHENVSFSHIFGTQMLNWYTCGVGTPLYVWLIDRVPLRRPWLAARLALYVAAIAACVVLKYIVWIPLQNAIFHSGWLFWPNLIQNVFAVALDQIYFLILLYAIEFYRSAREREVVASRLEAQLSQAQLQMLRSQLDPHFLFNTLNSISALMRTDVDAADAMLERLSAMLRTTLIREGPQEVRLREELALTNAYLDIMCVRFGDRLRTRVDVPEALLDEVVPSFMLQPLVENSVRHGLDESLNATVVQITARLDGDALVVCVSDDGCGLPLDSVPAEGIGLRNTRKRLERLYGDLGTLALANRSGGGTEVSIRVPATASRRRFAVDFPQ